MTSMRKKLLLEKTLCLTYCAYYKPDKNEELICNGYAVVEHLIKKGKIIISERSKTEIDCVIMDLLIKKICIACDFHEQDCDFMQNRTAPSCGGFILLAQQLMSGKITLDDIA